MNPKVEKLKKLWDRVWWIYNKLNSNDQDIITGILAVIGVLLVGKVFISLFMPTLAAKMVTVGCWALSLLLCGFVGAFVAAILTAIILALVKIVLWAIDAIDDVKTLNRKYDESDRSDKVR